jgi:hypothetical protein
MMCIGTTLPVPFSEDVRNCCVRGNSVSIWTPQESVTLKVLFFPPHTYDNLTLLSSALITCVIELRTVMWMLSRQICLCGIPYS